VVVCGVCGVRAAVETVLEMVLATCVAVSAWLLRLFWRWFWQRAWRLQLAALRLVVRVSAALGMGMAQHDITLLSTITHIQQILRQHAQTLQDSRPTQILVDS
jgi:hypothetical protein